MSGTLGSGTRRARRRPGRWSQRLGWVLGGFLVAIGALGGAFGTVAWLSVLCAPSLSQMLLGVLTLGLAPVVGGGAVLWAGLGILERQSARERVRALSDAHLVEGAQTGGTALAIAHRLGVGDVAEVTARLDELVARDVLALDLTDDGELVYQPRRPD